MASRVVLWNRACRPLGFMQQKRGWWFVPEVDAVRQMILAAINARMDAKAATPPAEASEAILAAYYALPEAMRERLEKNLDATPFLDANGVAAMKMVAERRTFFDLAMRAEHVGELVKRNCPAGDPLRELFTRCVSDEVGYAELAGMLAEFDGLPEDRRVSILNGWYPVEWPTKAEVLELTADTDSVFRELHIDRFGGGVSACHGFSMRHGIAAVEVSVREGSSKGDVIAESL